MSELEKTHRPERELASREESSGAGHASSADAGDPAQTKREARMWRDLGASRAPVDSADAATLAVDERGAGTPVDPGLAAKVGGQMGADVSSARVHTDPVSRQATRAMGARAFAYDKDIFLGQGESADDQQLLAHELAHVAQQSGGARQPQKKVAVGQDGSSAEREADEVAGAATSASAPKLLVVDGGPLAPGQMHKATFLEQLKPLVTAAANDELGRLGSAAACPYIAEYFAKYSALPATATLALVRKWIPSSQSAASATELFPLIAERVRAGVHTWRETGKIPPDLAAAEPALAAQAASAAPTGAPQAHKKSLDALEHDLGPGEAVDRRVAAPLGAEGARIHRGPIAQAKAAEADAVAFAVGRNVVMGAGAPAQGTVAGDALLAHELAHTAQQRDAAQDPTARKKPIGDEDQAAERDADRAAGGAVANQKLTTLGNFAGRVGDVMRTGLQLQRCANNVEPGVQRADYYRTYMHQMAIDAGDHLKTLPFATYDAAVTWKGDGAKRFAEKMASQIVAPPTDADLDSLVRPELIGKLIDESRVMNHEPNSGIQTEKGADAYFGGVGITLGNALARRTAESLQREVPRYAQMRLADGKEPTPDEVTLSHPIDYLVVAALAQGNVVAIDGEGFKTRHPELAGPPKKLNQTRNVRLEPVDSGGGYWYRLQEPADASVEEIAMALTGSPTEAFRIEDAHPLYGLKGDTRGKFDTEDDGYQNPAGVLISEGGSVADEAALSQAGSVAGKSARSRERILEQMNLNASLLKTTAREAAQRFGLGSVLDGAAAALTARVARLSTAPENEVAKWDSQTQQQQQLIAQGTSGLEVDHLRLQAYSAQFGGDLEKDPEALTLPDSHRVALRGDAEMWAKAIAVSDLVKTAQAQILTASQHSMTLEMDILEAGLSSPQAAAHEAAGSKQANADFDGAAMSQRELDLRKRLGVMRAQMVADPTKVDTKAGEQTNEETRNLIFESQVVSQATSLAQAWDALDDADGWMSHVTFDSGDIKGLKAEGKRYYARWQGIYANIKKGEKGDKAAMAAARTAFETLCAEKEFISYLKRVNDLLQKVQKHHLIATLIAMVVITVASMGAGAAMSGFLGGTAVVVEGTEVVVGGIGVARNTAAIAGFLTEVATFSFLSNRAFSKDNSVGAVVTEFGKNLILFGAMRGVAAGFKAAGLAKVIEGGLKEGASVADIMKAGGAMGAEAIVNGGAGVLMAVIEAKVKEAIGGKPMTEEELDQTIRMTVAQTVIFTIGGRLLMSPVRKLEIKAGFEGQKWLNAIRSSHALEAAIKSEKAPTPERVLEIIRMDSEQVLREHKALEELMKAGEKDPMVLERAGISQKELAAQEHALDVYKQLQRGMGLSMTMKEIAPNHFAVERMYMVDVMEAQREAGTGIRLESVDPITGATTHLFTPQQGTPFRVTEQVPDWATTRSGQRVIMAATRAGVPDHTLYSLKAKTIDALIKADEAVAKGDDQAVVKILDGSGLDAATRKSLEPALRNPIEGHVEVHNHIVGVPGTDYFVNRVGGGDAVLLFEKTWKLFSEKPALQKGAPDAWRAAQETRVHLDAMKDAPAEARREYVRGQLDKILAAGPDTAFDQTYEIRDELIQNHIDAGHPQFKNFAKDALTELHDDGVMYSEQSTSAKKLDTRFDEKTMSSVHQELKAEGKDVDVRFLAMFPTDMFSGPETPESRAKFEALKTQIGAILQRADAMGVDIAGPEMKVFTPEGMKRFAEIYDLVAEAARIRKRPMVLRPHVGEGYVPKNMTEQVDHEAVAQQNMKAMIEFLQKRGYNRDKDNVIIRFGHATHATPDQFKAMHDLGIIVEANIGSNLATQSIPALQDHPLLYSLYYDTPTILSTDGHGVMGTNMAREYRAAESLITQFKAGNAAITIDGKPLRYADLPASINGKPKEVAFSVETLKRWAQDYYHTVRAGDMTDEKRVGN